MRLRFAPLTLLALFAAPLPAQHDDFVGTGFLGSVYRLDSPTGNADPLLNTGWQFPESMTSDGAGNYYAIARPDRKLLQIDPRTGYATVLHDLQIGAQAIAHAGGNTLYLMKRGPWGSTDQFYTLDLSTGAETFIGWTNHVWVEGLALASNGVLYAWDSSDGLCTVDIATGATTDLFPGAGGLFGIYGLAFTPNGDLYGSGDALYSIDLATGLYTQIGPTWPYGIRGLAYYDSTPNDCLLLESTPMVAGAPVTFTVSGVPDGSEVGIAYSFQGGTTALTGQAGYCATLGLGNLTIQSLLGSGLIQAGSYQLTLNIPASARGRLVLLQAAQRGTCPGECVSNVLAEVVQ